MAKLSALEKRRFEDLFGMSSGYVMNLYNSDFEELFRSTIGLNIYSNKYETYGTSKAKRLRAFWEQEPDLLVGKILKELLQVWEYENDSQLNNKAFIACKETVSRLIGKSVDTEDDFLEKDFGEISFDKLSIEEAMVPIMKNRHQEACRCLKAGASLSVIFLCGSMLEGILLGTAIKNANNFVKSKSAPKDSKQNVLQLQNWKLGNLIDVACDIKLLSEDVKKFSHALRDFRNYIHPYEQMLSGFDPDKHTAKMCLQVLNAVISDLRGERKK